MDDRLYDLAFELRKLKLWDSLEDTEIFAVRFSDGGTGYVSIMGNDGVLRGLNVYPGDAGFLSMMKVLETELEPDPETTFFEEQEHLFRQDCVQVSFGCRSDVDEETAADIGAYAKSKGIRLAGKNAYPAFLRLSPAKIPWHIISETDRMYIAEALECAVWLARELKVKTVRDFGFECLENGPETLPLFIREGGGYVLKSMPLPEILSETYVSPRYIDELSASKLMKNVNKSILECLLIQWPAPMSETEEEIPCFPKVIVAADAESGYMVVTDLVPDYENNPEKLVNAFVSALAEHKIRPDGFKAADSRTFCLLKPLASALGVDIEVNDCLPMLDEAVDYLEDEYLTDLYGEDDYDDFDEYDDFEEFDDEEGKDIFDGVLDEMENAPDHVLKMMPAELIRALEVVMKDRNTSPDMAARIRRILKRAGKS